MTQHATATGSWSEQFHRFERNGAEISPAWLRDVRRSAFSDFERLGFPTARKGNEPWKYTNVRPIAEAAFAFAEHALDASGGVDLHAYELPCPRVHQLVFVDGHYEPGLSTEPVSEAGLHNDVLPRRGDGPVVGRLADAIEYRVPLVREHLGRLAPAQGNAFTALNTAFLRDGAFVHIPDGTFVPEPIYLLFISTGAQAVVTHPRVLIAAGADSSATVLQSFHSLNGGTYLTNALTEAVTGPGASLRLCTLQREGNDAYHIATTRMEQGRDSRITSVAVDLGGRLVRREIATLLGASGASVNLCGLYYGAGERHIDNQTFIDHAVPGASSNEVYKGILGDSSHGVFAGGVLVRPDAQQTVAHQVNKNLLLSSDAEVDTQPKLEIYADDVTCTHGAAVGQLDADALFYLKSRGIGEDTARNLLVHGFVSEVLDAIEDGAVRQHVESAVAACLSGSE